MSKITNVLVTTAMLAIGATASQAATFGFEAVSGGEMASEAVTVVGDPNGFTAFGLEFSMTAIASPAAGDVSKQEFVFAPVPGFSTTLALSMVEQMFGSGLYQGVYEVVTDVSGLWGDYALVEVTASALDGFTSGALKITEVEKVEQTTPIPLPAGAFLILTGLAGMAALRRAKS